jgi:hypothetical protein
MKVTLAIALAVHLSSGIGAVWGSQAPQQQTPTAEMPQSSAGQPAAQPQGAPPALQPCPLSKDTCEISEPAAQQAPSTPVVKSEEQQKAKTSRKSVAAKRTKKHRHKRIKTDTVAQNGSGPKRTVVRQGGTSDPATVLTPGATAQNDHARQMTTDLLSATDANLKQATSRQLNANQEETVTQIKLFVEQANAAMKAGDLDRGHNLAIKAHLLSDDLVKH